MYKTTPGAMNAHDLDKAHIKVHTAFGDNNRLSCGHPDPAAIFQNPRIVEGLYQEKALLTKFSLARILSLLPFAPTLYVEVCPRCLTRGNVTSLESLTKAGLVIPVLQRPYCDFDRPVFERLVGLDHISFWQYDIFRFASLSANGMQSLCQGCVERTQNEILARVPYRRGIRSRLVTRLDINMVFHNLYPYAAPDEELLAVVSQVACTQSREDMMLLGLLSFSIRKLRTAQAFNASLIVDDHDIGQPPARALNKTDVETQTSMRLAELVSQGIAVRVPENVPLDAYIELVREFRPAIRNVSAGLIDSARIAPGDVNLVALINKITDFNHELERVKRSRRYLLLEAIGAKLRNRGLMKALLTATGLGIAGRLARGMMRDDRGEGTRSRRIQGSLTLGKRLLADVRPYMTKVAALYLGTNEAAVHMLLTQRRLEAIGGAPPDRRLTIAQSKEPLHLH